MKMKTAVFAVALALSACLFAKEADLRIDGRNPPATVMRDWTPLSVTLVSPVALPPGSWNVYGLRGRLQLG